MKTPLGNTLRGIVFFSTFWPSFTRVGYDFRKSSWGTVNPDLSGQTWLVTGASAGIGREIALAAARHGARVIAVARRRDPLDALARESGGSIEPWVGDVSLMSNVAELAAASPSVHVLVNNVGVMFNRPETTDEDIDAGFATNLLGHYVLTEHLIALDKLAAGGAIVSMSSGGAYTVPLELEPLTHMRPYDGTLAYAYHKRAQVTLNAYWRGKHGSRFQFYVAHPGWVDTPGVADAMPAFRAAFGLLLRDAAAGADTAFWLATERPDQAEPDSLWFDRAEHPAHLLPGTRNGADPADLITLLETYAPSAQTPDSMVTVAGEPASEPGPSTATG